MFGRKKEDYTITQQKFIHFNLLPEDYLARRRRAALNMAQIILVLALIFGIGGLTFQQYMVLGDYQSHTQAAEEEILLYSEALEVEKELATYREEQQRRQDFIEAAALPIDMNRALEDVAESIPGAVRLTELYVEGPYGIIMGGTASTLNQISHFSSVLRDEVEYLSEPFVTFPSQLGPDNELERISFRMEIPWDLDGDPE